MNTKNQRIADFQALVAANHGNITDAFTKAWESVGSVGEVPRLREFLSGANKGVHLLNHELPKHFVSRGFELKFAAILVHAKPIVIPLENLKTGAIKTGLPANPELGDLNVVFLFLDRAKNVKMARSILYQAKTVRKSLSQAIQDPHQIYLYDKAQGYKYRDGPYAGEVRQLPIAGQRRKGLHYLFVSENPVACSASPADRPAYSNWSESMFRLLMDAEGIGIAAGQARGSGWSKINEDLVHIFKHDAKLRASNLSELASWFNSFKDPNHWFEEASKEAKGINTMFVIIRDQKLPAGDEEVPEPPKLVRREYIPPFETMRTSSY
ncbi:MAG: hypothetical protein V4675_09300 [Verrucomicrobiota bacterium]